MEGERLTDRPPRRLSRFTCPKKNGQNEGNTRQFVGESIQIILGETTFYAAKEVVTKHSLYFRRALENDVTLSKVDISVLQIGSEAFDVLHRWMFGRNLGLTITNVATILDAAHKLQMPEAASVCAEFMESELRLDNHYHVMSDKQACDIKSFQQVVHDQCFLELTADQVCLILSNDNIDIKKEKEVFDAAVKWLRHNWEQRKEHVARVIGCVRFGLMSDRDILDITRRNLNLSVMETPECQAFALYGLLYHSAQRAGNSAERKRFAPQQRLWLRDGEMRPSDQPAPTPRKCHKADRGDCVSTSASSLSNSDPSEFCSVSENTVKKSLLLINEWDLVVGEDKTATWPRLAANTTHESNLTSLHQNEVIARQVAGGVVTDRGLERNQCHIPKAVAAAIKIQRAFRHLRVKRKMWKNDPAHQRTRANSCSSQSIPCINALDGPCILALGTIDPFVNEQDIRTRVFKYSPVQNEWRLMGHLPHAVIQAGTVAFGETIYFIGGSSARPGNNKLGELTPVKSTCVWGIRKGSWQQLQDMNYSRAYHGVAMCARKIYAIGGLGIRKRLLATAEVFCLSAHQWTVINNLPRAQMSAAVATYRKHIWVCGGIGHSTGVQTPHILRSVHQFCPHNGKWKTLSNLPVGRSFSTLCHLAGRLLLIGGVVNPQMSELYTTSMVDVYDDTLDTWRPSHALIHPRHASGAAVLGDSMYIVGGASTKSQTLLTSVECLSRVQGHLNEKVAPLPVSLIGVSCVAVNVQSSAASAAKNNNHQGCKG